MINKYGSSEGQAIVEFALILPVLLLIFAGMAEFGILFYNKQVLTNAVREGARAGIVHKDVNGDPWVANIPKIVQDYCKDRLVTFGGSGVPTVIYTPDPAALTYPDELTVTATLSYTYLMPSILNMFGGSFGPTLDISGIAVMNSE